MDNDREKLHRTLDGEGGGDDRLPAGASRDEREGLRHAVELLEGSERRSAPEGFTAAVMARLPEARQPRAARLREFFFGSRVLRWNMATALATAAVLVVAALAVLPRTPADGMVTVRLTFYAPQASTVAVAGDFNKWRIEGSEMKRIDGMWSADLRLRPGVYSYSFVVDGRTWVVDPGASSYEDDGLGSRNAVLRVQI
jgi:hypothetical protein